jgi:hypothetical protein
VLKEVHQGVHREPASYTPFSAFIQQFLQENSAYSFAISFSSISKTFCKLAYKQFLPHFITVLIH